MSAKFDGFSQEEINRINEKPKKIGRLGRGIRRLPDDQETKMSKTENQQKLSTNQNKNIKNGIKVSAITINGNNRIDNEHKQIDYERKISDESLVKLHAAVMFQPLEKKSEIIEEIQDNKITNETSFASDESIVHLNNVQNEKNIPQKEKKSTKDSTKFENDLEYNEQMQMSPFRGVSLKDFEIQRKLREEQNKIKKEMLYKAIEQHTQKTAAEVKKIEEIKGELAKLDQDLAADVAILRKQIESACIQYSNLEKHYNKVEQMFLKAKMDLHQASEKKELLTEHLCTVITHNEDRKAKKLSELMEKVGLSPTTGEIQEISSPIEECK